MPRTRGNSHPCACLVLIDACYLQTHVLRYIADGTEEMPPGGIYNLPDDQINDETLSMYYESLLEGIPYQTLGDFGPGVAGWSEGDLVFSANEIINVWDEVNFDIILAPFLTDFHSPIGSSPLNRRGPPCCTILYRVLMLMAC